MDHLEYFNFRAILSCLLLGVLIFHLFLPWLRAVVYLRHVPGYKMNPLIFYFLALKYLYKNKLVPFTYYMLEYGTATCVLFQKQGIVKVWLLFRPVVMLFKPETVEAVLCSNTTIEKSNEYYFLHPWLGTGLLTSGGDKWRNRRKLLTPAFHFRILEDFLPIFNEHSFILVNHLKKLCHKEWIDAVSLVTKCTLDIICQSTMGVRINAQDDPQSEYIKAINEVSDQFMYRLSRLWLWINGIYFLFPSGRGFRKNLKVLHSFTRKVIKEKKKELLSQKANHSKESETESSNEQVTHRKRKAFLELLLELHINGASLTEEDIREEVDTFMFEGHDTTAMAISWTLYNVGLCPDVQEKVLTELDDIFADDKERPITTDDLKEMKYLECVLKESLRLYPSVPIIAREVKKDIVIEGYTITPCAVCVIIPYMLHRDPETYPNPEVFDPDRFLPENSIGRHPYAYVPFSAGPRNCIGQRFALMEEKTILANIFRNFKIKSLDPRDRIIVIPDLILRSKDPLRIQLIPR